MSQFGNALYDLIEKGVLAEQGLQHNETFNTTVPQASMMSIRRNQQGKLEVFRNPVLNVAKCHGLEEDLRQLYFNFIDVCTVSRIRLLSLINGSEEWSQKHEVEFPSSWSDLLVRLVPVFTNVSIGLRRDSYWSKANLYG